MLKSPLVAMLAALACAACACSPALSLATSSAPPKAYFYTGFDPDVLYLAARVEDPFVVGTHTEPMSEAWADDAVGFYLDLPRLRSDYPHPRCLRLIVSAAGGFMASVGTDQGTWRPAPEWMAGLKLDVSVQGTLNNATDVDEGFTVEAAIPWRFLGGLPPDRARIGFNAVCFVRGENETFVSWSPDVKAEADLDRPSTWGDMLIRRGGSPQKPTDREVTCPLLVQRVLIDGKLSADEWIGASVIELVKPMPRPVAAAVKAAPRGGLVAALYRCDYQADPRLGPVVGPAAPGIAGAIVNQPMSGIGPWLCADRVDWHRQQLADLAQAGLDTILPMAAVTASGELQPRRGLSALARALQEARGREQPYPLVGLYLDLSSAPTAEAGRVAGAVIEFFRTIPQEFWAELDATNGPGPGRVRLAVLAPPGSGTVDRSLLVEISKAFAAEFPGDRLEWLADVGWRDKVDGVTAYCGLGGSETLDFQANENHPVAVISPGYDDGKSASIVDRLDGSRYETAWTKALGLAPRMVILRSWNDFTNATEVAASRQHGLRYMDLTRRFLAEWGSHQPGRLRLLRETLPAALIPGGEYRVDLLLRNASLDTLSTSDTVSAGYRIEEETGRVVSRVRSAFSLRLPAGATRMLSLAVRMRDDQKAPLKAGRYRLVVEFLSSKVPLLRSRWFEKTVAEVPVMVTVGPAPARLMTVLEASLPTRMEAGGDYPVRLHLRNDGASEWSVKSLALVGRWYRRGASPAAQPEVVGEGARLRLPHAVAPGQVLDLRATLRAQAAEKPLPPGVYEVRWDLEGDRAGSSPPPCGTMVEVVAHDAGALFVKSDLPGTLQAGSATPVKVVVSNVGRRAWEPAATRITYHWAYWDGAPAPDEADQAPVDRAIQPGDSAVVSLPVRAPAVGGSYWLWWDVVGADGSAASAVDEAGGSSLMPAPVVVGGGRYATLDLAPQANVAFAAPDGWRIVGNLDGNGNSLPSELVPPDVGPVAVTAYPSGYFAAPIQSASPPEREVAFAYPRRVQGRLDAVACRGQQIALPAGRTVRLHLLGAAAEAGVLGAFQVAYDDGSSATLPLTMSDWREDPQQGEAIALSINSYRSQQATRRGAAHLYHYLLALDAGKTAKTLTLPDDRRMVIVAITAERAQ